MKNQYFGDINDYHKYGLLRVFALAKFGPISVCWMMTHDDDRKDGHLTKYLSDSATWEKYDPPLFRFLNKEVLWKKERTVSAMRRSDLIPKSRFYCNYIKDDIREPFLQGFSHTLWKKGLIFFDPDNGLEVPSVKKHSSGSCRYLYWNEVNRFYKKGYSLLIYQHFPRVNREQYINARAREIFASVAADEVYCFKTSKVGFFCIPQRAERGKLKDICSRIRSQWKEKFSIFYITKQSLKAVEYV
jgi:hypothetical protein